MTFACRVAFASVLISLPLLHLPAQAPMVQRLTPSSKWVVNYADDSCRLTRSFGTGENQVILFMDQFEPSESFRLRLLGKSITPPANKMPVVASIRFGPKEEAFDIYGLAATTADLPTVIFTESIRIAPRTKAEDAVYRAAWRPNPPAAAAKIGPDRERGAKFLQVSKMLRYDLILETGQMQSPLEALRTCSRDTISRWGIDVVAHEKLTREAWPAAPPSTWFLWQEYPKHMIRTGNQAIVNFRVMIDDKGHPTSCHIQQSTRPKAFDDLVCKSIMKRARFSPALDAAGRPIPSYFRNTVNYRLK